MDEGIALLIKFVVFAIVDVGTALKLNPAIAPMPKPQ